MSAVAAATTGAAASNVRINALAVVGKQNNPLFVKNFTTQPDLKYHFMAHTSCDVIEERVAAGVKNYEPYLGLLYAMEDLAVFGYLTNTRVKFILMVAATDTAIKDQEIKALFRRIHSAFIDLQFDPFWDPESIQMIQSQKFARRIDDLVAKNTAAASI
eukprot:jgi/Hompol1/137/HPOL_003276-RA